MNLRLAICHGTMHTPILGTVILSLAATLTAQRWTAQNGLPHRYEHALAFDVATGGIVVFGGSVFGTGYGTSDTQANFGDTWVRDANGWHEVGPAQSPGPGPRTRHAMAYDSLRQRLVLFGGLATNPGTPDAVIVDDTWEFDGALWTQRNPLHRPSARIDHGMTWHAAQGRIVLWGGMAALPYGGHTYDTWQYDGIDWVQATPGATPSVLGANNLVYAPALNRTVLCSYPSTWEYDGANWAQVPTAHQLPLSNYSQTSASVDATGNVLVLALDYGLPIAALSTWRYDGVDWTQVTTAHTPPIESLGPMTWDATRNRVVLVADGAVWEFDGVDWVLADPTSGFARRMAAPYAHDSHRHCLVSFGGWTAANPQTNAHWEWHGSGWQVVPQNVAPGPRRNAHLAYDSRRERLVLHGGDNLHDTWEYNGSQWHQVLTPHDPWAPVTAMTYDPVQGHCIALASSPSSTYWPWSSTFAYDGNDWTEMVTPTLLPPRLTPTLAWNAARDAISLYGGYWGYGVYTDNWELRDGDWHQLSPQIRPPVAHARGGYDTARGKLVVDTGPSLTQHLPGGWFEFDGTSWQPLPSQPVLPIWYPMLPLVFDPARGCLLAISHFGDVWAYEPAPLATWAKLGRGCTQGSSPTLDAAAGSTPSLGGTFVVQITDLPPQPGALFLTYGFGFSTYQGRALPVDLGFLGQPDCLLWIEPAGLGAFVAHSGGSASLGIQLPANGALAGTRFTMQGLTFDMASPTGLGAPTNAGVATVY